MRKGYFKALSLVIGAGLVCGHAHARPLLDEPARDIWDGAYFPYFCFVTPTVPLSARMAFPGVGDSAVKRFTALGYRGLPGRGDNGMSENLHHLYGAGGLGGRAFSVGAYVTDAMLSAGATPVGTYAKYALRCGVWVEPVRGAVRGVSVEYASDGVADGDTLDEWREYSDEGYRWEGWRERGNRDVSLRVSSLVALPGRSGSLIVRGGVESKQSVDSLANRRRHWTRDSLMLDDGRVLFDTTRYPQREYSLEKGKASRVEGELGYVFPLVPSLFAMVSVGMAYRRASGDTTVDDAWLRYDDTTGEWDYRCPPQREARRAEYGIVDLYAEAVQGRAVPLGAVTLLWGLGASYEISMTRRPGMHRFMGHIKEYWRHNCLAEFSLRAPLMLRWEPGRFMVSARWQPGWKRWRNSLRDAGHGVTQRRTSHAVELVNYGLGFSFRPTERMSIGFAPAYSGTMYLARLEGRYTW